jgi:restriction endonuclease HindI-like protein
MICVRLHSASLRHSSHLTSLVSCQARFCQIESVKSVKKNLKVDWTKPHREDVKAAVRAAVKVVLRKRGVTKERLAR